MPFPRRTIPAVAVAVLVTAFAVFFFRRIRSEESAARPLTLLTAGSDAGYVNAAACSGCHRAIWDKYRKTGMGRSLQRVRPGTPLEGLEEKRTFHHQGSERFYTMDRKDGRYYQRRHQTGFDGRETNVVEKEIHFVIGSGNHARTYLHRTEDGGIVELPVAWYSEKGGYWAMNPGYDRPNHDDFRRRIAYECVFCHTAYPEIRPGADAIGGEPVFPAGLPEGIDCQRCHGPGRDHIQAAAGGKSEQIRRAIVNPARLSPDRQLEVCMQCHLETTSGRLPHAILRYQRGAFSYRPGEPLSAYALHFDHAPGSRYDDKFQIAHQAYRLLKSPCFQKSAGRLTCTTCHDPHDAPRGERAVERYTSACRGCHASGLAKQVAAGRHTGAADCLACHMPRRRTDDVVHVVMTDHYIQRKKPAGDLLAPLREHLDTAETAYQGRVTLYYPRQLSGAEAGLYLAVAQVKQFTNLKEGIAELAGILDRDRPQPAEPYLELAEACAHGGQVEPSIRWFEEALRRKPDLIPALLGMGRILSKAGQYDRAVEALEKALRAAPRQPTILNDLGLVYLRQRKPAQAQAAFRKSLEIDPSQSEAYANLGSALRDAGDPAGAEEAYRNAIQVQPDFSEAHRNLAALMAAREDFAQAEYHYRKAIENDPGDSTATLAEAHSSLGDMLALQGKVSLATKSYRQSLALKPDMAAAHLGLGSALAAEGRGPEAMAHLRVAAQSPDPSIQGPARDALQALGSSRR